MARNTVSIGSRLPLPPRCRLSRQTQRFDAIQQRLLVEHFLLSYMSSVTLCAFLRHLSLRLWHWHHGSWVWGGKSRIFGRSVARGQLWKPRCIPVEQSRFGILRIKSSPGMWTSFAAFLRDAEYGRLNEPRAASRLLSMELSSSTSLCKSGPICHDGARPSQHKFFPQTGRLHALRDW